MASPRLHHGFTTAISSSKGVANVEQPGLEMAVVEPCCQMWIILVEHGWWQILIEHGFMGANISVAVRMDSWTATDSNRWPARWPLFRSLLTMIKRCCLTRLSMINHDQTWLTMINHDYTWLTMITSHKLVNHIVKLEQPRQCPGRLTFSCPIRPCCLPQDEAWRAPDIMTSVIRRLVSWPRHDHEWSINTKPILHRLTSHSNPRINH